jgi:hypothetical protein
MEPGSVEIRAASDGLLAKDAGQSSPQEPQQSKKAMADDASMAFPRNKPVGR